MEDVKTAIASRWRGQTHLKNLFLCLCMFSKTKKLQHTINLCFPQRRAFHWLLCWVSFPFQYLSLKQTHSINFGTSLLHFIFMLTVKTFVLTLSSDKYVTSWSSCWKLKYSSVLVEHLFQKYIALWAIKHDEFYNFQVSKVLFMKKSCLHVIHG